MNVKVVIALGVGLVIGGLLMYFLVPKGGPEQVAAEGAGQLYSCGMHPEVISDKPGDCPICGMKLTPIKSTGAAAQKPTGERKILYWRAPMDPTEIYDKPGQSRMGMDLIPVYEGEEAGGAGSITIDGRVGQNMNLRTARVERRDITRVVRAFGRVTYAEDRQFSVNTKVDGWIEKLYVNTTGQRVKKGEPLLEIYSPELISTMEEYLLAVKDQERLTASEIGNVRKSAEVLLASARNRLVYWDISEDEIQNVEETKVVPRTILLRAPIDGIVTHKAVVKGDKVSPGTDLFHIADLTTVWIEATVYESELALVRKNQRAELELDYAPGETFDGKVDFVYPFLDPKSRAGNVRLVFDNPKERLKPDMFTTVRIHSRAAKDALSIPSEAVIHSGDRTIVFVSRGEGVFEPRQVTVGAEGDDGFVQVISGLFDADEVVTSGQFLLDSESRTREAIAKMRAAQGNAAGQGSDEKDIVEPQSREQEAPKEHAQEHHVEAVDQMPEHEHAALAHEHAGEGLYACPMHPDFITSDPSARCPECGMKLTGVDELGDKVNLDDATFYTCPMHPKFVTTDKDARCPECGMELEKVLEN